MSGANPIDRYFGTWRGLARLALSHGQALSVRPANLTNVRRLVFVCHGNICRSAFADVVARDLGMQTASFGLSTSAGLSAHPPIVDAARQRGIDLRHHRTTRVEDFEPRSGDLLLAMEMRQITKLRADPRFDSGQIDLLGRHAGVPHIHDPYRLNEDYVRVCLARIDRAVQTLVKRIATAKA